MPADNCLAVTVFRVQGAIKASRVRGVLFADIGPASRVFGMEDAVRFFCNTSRVLGLQRTESASRVLGVKAANRINSNTDRIFGVEDAISAGGVSRVSRTNSALGIFGMEGAIGLHASGVGGIERAKIFLASGILGMQNTEGPATRISRIDIADLAIRGSRVCLAIGNTNRVLWVNMAGAGRGSRGLANGILAFRIFGVESAVRIRDRRAGRIIGVLGAEAAGRILGV